MAKIIAPITGLGLVLILTGPAPAASPAYCALYAREYAKEFVRTEAKLAGTSAEQGLQDRAFYKCLNMDEAPPLPEASAYASFTAAAVGGPLVNDSLAAPAPGTVPATDGETASKPVVNPPTPAPRAQAPAPETTTKVAQSQEPGISRLKSGTRKWRLWCEEHFPNSFDRKTGTVLPFDSGKRAAC